MYWHFCVPDSGDTVTNKRFFKASENTGERGHV